MYQPTDVHPGGLLCPLEDLENPGDKAFNVIFDDGHEVEIFVIRRGPDAFAYVNVCPHQFLPLNWKTDNFLSFDKTCIVCVMHAARFDIETGEMIYGPICPDCRLRPVPVGIENGTVRLANEGIPRF